MELVVAQDMLRQHVTDILCHIDSLLQTQLEDEQYQAVTVSEQNARECMELLNKDYDMSAVDLSDYWSHHIRNLLTPVNAYMQFLEIYDADSLDYNQLNNLHAISDGVHLTCDILKLLQQEMGSAGYRKVDIA